MSDTTSIAPRDPARDRRMLLAMTGIGLLCAFLIVLTFEGTRNRIERNKAEALEQAVFRVLPGTETSVPYLRTADDRLVKAETGEEGIAFFSGYDASGNWTGVAIPAAGQGYADIIRILYGYDPEKKAVVGMYVLESKETPGLGDKIEKDEAFTANFEALDVSLNEAGTALKNQVIYVKSGEKSNPWEVDGITGATISSRAIGDMLGVSTAEWVPLIQAQKSVFTDQEPTNE